MELVVFILEKKMLWRMFYMFTKQEGMKKRQPKYTGGGQEVGWGYSWDS